MSGFSSADYLDLSEKEQYPELVKWFRPESRPSNHKKIVALWPFAGYAKEPRRSASKKYWEELVLSLIRQGYGVCQFGHFNDPVLFDDCDLVDGNEITGNFKRFNNNDFFEQVRITLSTDCVLSTDSGSGLIFAAYGHPQVNLINRHWPGHVRNGLALAPIGKETYNFLGDSNCDDISQQFVLDKVIEKCGN